MKRITCAVALLAFLATANADEIKRHAFDRAGIPISRAVEVPPAYVMVYHSGVTPQPADPKARPGTPEFWGNTRIQTHSVFLQMRQSLQSLGLEFKDIVKMTVFLAGDPALGGAMDFNGFMDAYREYFGTPAQPALPARSTVQVAGLVAPGMLVEIEAVLARPRAK